MAAPLHESADRRIGYISSDQWKTNARRRPATFRLTVLATSPATAVAQIGGWLFDMCAAGWEVSVCVVGDIDPRPLEILGAVVVELEQALISVLDEIRPIVIATAMDDYRSNPSIRARVLRHLTKRDVQVVIWGAQDSASDLTGRLELATHRVSVAGLAFRACALSATGAVDESVEPTEEFWATDPGSWQRIGALHETPTAGTSSGHEPRS